MRRGWFEQASPGLQPGTAEAILWGVLLRLGLTGATGRTGSRSQKVADKAHSSFCRTVKRGGTVCELFYAIESAALGLDGWCAGKCKHSKFGNFEGYRVSWHACPVPSHYCVKCRASSTRQSPPRSLIGRETIYSGKNGIWQKKECSRELTVGASRRSAPFFPLPVAVTLRSRPRTAIQRFGGGLVPEVF